MHESSQGWGNPKNFWNDFVCSANFHQSPEWDSSSCILNQKVAIASELLSVFPFSKQKTPGYKVFPIPPPREILLPENTGSLGCHFTSGEKRQTCSLSVLFHYCRREAQSKQMGCGGEGFGFLAFPHTGIVFWVSQDNDKDKVTRRASDFPDSTANRCPRSTERSNRETNCTNKICSCFCSLSN